MKFFAFRQVMTKVIMFKISVVFVAVIGLLCLVYPDTYSGFRDDGIASVNNILFLLMWLCETTSLYLLARRELKLTIVFLAYFLSSTGRFKTNIYSFSIMSLFLCVFTFLKSLLPQSTCEEGLWSYIYMLLNVHQKFKSTQ